ncbi:MAG: hypothetical protein WHU94_17020 [Thermogemmata sp.]
MGIRHSGVLGVALLSGVAAGAAEPRPLPTTPQVPPLTLTAEPPGRGSSVPYGSRIHVPPGERPALALREQAEMAVHPGVGDSPMSLQGIGRSSPSSVRSIIPGSPIKAWLFFYPTTGKALPCFQPRPYVGPITGTFPCTSAPALSSGVGRPHSAGCCSAHGSLPLSRGARSSSTVSGRTLPAISDGMESPAGYRFAQAESQKLLEQLLLPARSGYAPPPKGFWNTPAPRVLAVPPSMGQTQGAK